MLKLRRSLADLQSRIDQGAVFVPSLIAFAVFLLIIMIRDGAGWADPGIDDPDSILRLFIVRELLDGGLGWFDNRIARLDPPEGALIHWSRLVDAPLVLLTGGLRWFFAPPSAEVLAAVIWPLLLSWPFLWLAARLGYALTGASGAILPSLVAAISTLLILSGFQPGFVDHHNVQVLLSLAMLCGAVRLQRSHSGGFEAGLAAAVSIAIGMEAALFVFLIAAFVALIWLIRGPALKGAACSFGLTLGGATLILAVILIPLDRYAVAACDMFSSFQVAMLALGGLGLAALAACPWATDPRHRWIGAGLLSFALALAFAWIAPQCLGGPYAELHPRLAAEWLPVISEAKGFHQALDQDWGMTLTFIILSTVSIAALLLLSPVFPGGEAGQWRTESILITGLLLTALALTVTQFRMYVYVLLFSMPGLVLLVTRTRVNYGLQGGVLALLRLAAAWIFLFPTSYLLIFVLLEDAARIVYPGLGADQAQTGNNAGGDRGNEAEKPICYSKAFYSSFAGLPPGLVINHLNLAPYLLLYTPHQVVGGNYHRNPRGILDSMDFFAGDWDSARRIAQRRGAAYVALCRDGEGTDESMDAEEGAAPIVSRALRSNESLPDWLIPVSLPLDSPLMIYRINAGRFSPD